MTNAQRFKRFQRWEKMIAAKTADARRQAWIDTLDPRMKEEYEGKKEEN